MGWDLWSVAKAGLLLRGAEAGEMNEWKSEEAVKWSMRNGTYDERLNEWMNLPQAQDFEAL